MSGYTPAFADMYMGTLYGRWPAAAVWATLLPLMDKRGHIDMSVQAISGMTGWPIELLQQGIQQLMEADPESRTSGQDGRRLVPIDPKRPWGWIAVNHSKYREKARLQSKDADRTSSGADAERKRKEREKRPTEPEDVPLCPPESPDVPLSDSDSDSDSDKEGDSDARAREAVDRGRRQTGPPTQAGEICRAMKDAGIMDVNPSFGKLLTLLGEGADTTEFVQAAKDSVAKGNPKFAYALGMVEGRRRDAAAGKPTGLKGPLVKPEPPRRVLPDALEVARARDAPTGPPADPERVREGIERLRQQLGSKT